VVQSNSSDGAPTGVDTIEVFACPLKHTLPALGFVFVEAERAAKLDAAKAAKLGVTGRLLGDLKMGKDVVSSTTGRLVEAKECLMEKPPRRKVGIIQDTYDASSAEEALENVDLLVHECTYEEALQEKAIDHGHSTSAMAGRFAAKVKAKHLVLTHFSPRYESVEGLVVEAKNAAEGHVAQISAAEDFMEVKV
jgi:ribonuclease Z